MTLEKPKPRKTWLCPKCRYRNEATRSRKCGECGELSRPKKRVPPHKRKMRDTPHDAAAVLSVQIHGGELGSCAVCGRPKKVSGNHDRDHDHRTGEIRGVVCWNCNRELLRGHTLETLRACVAYLERVEAFYAERVV